MKKINLVGRLWLIGRWIGCFYPHGCPLTCGHDAKPIDYASFEARYPNSERACHEMIWLEHRELLAEQRDMDDIITAISKIHEHRAELRECAEKTRV